MLETCRELDPVAGKQVRGSAFIRIFPLDRTARIEYTIDEIVLFDAVGELDPFRR